MLTISFLFGITVLTNKLLKSFTEKKAYFLQGTSISDNVHEALSPVHLFNCHVLNLVHLLPSIFQNYLTPTSSIHRWETRHNKLTHVNTRFGQRNEQILRYNGTQLRNRLPNNLSNNIASQSFRNKLKLLLICDQMKKTACMHTRIIIDCIIHVNCTILLTVSLISTLSSDVFIFVILFVYRRPVLMSVCFSGNLSRAQHLLHCNVVLLLEK